MSVSRKSVNVRRLCLQAVMMALFVVLELFSVKIGANIKITFSGLPIILMAVCAGPVSGMITGLGGAFLSQLISYGLTTTTVLWILPAGVRGLVMGLLFLLFRRSEKWPVLSLEILLSSLCVTLVNTAVMYVDSLIWNYYSFAYVFGMTAYRLLGSVLTAAAFSLVMPLLLHSLRRLPVRQT